MHNVTMVEDTSSVFKCYTYRFFVILFLIYMGCFFLFSFYITGVICTWARYATVRADVAKDRSSRATRIFNTIFFHYGNKTSTLLYRAGKFFLNSVSLPAVRSKLNELEKLFKFGLRRITWVFNSNSNEQARASVLIIRKGNVQSLIRYRIGAQHGLVLEPGRN